MSDVNNSLISAPKLTPKQQKFIYYYLSNGNNGTQAAIDAGYSKKTAYVIATENLKKPYIKQRIDQKLAIKANKHEHIVEELIQDLKDVKDKSKQMIVNNGEVQWTPAYCKTTELLGKQFGMFIERKIVVNTGMSILKDLPTVDIEDDE